MAFKHADDDLEDQKIEKIMERDGVSYPRGPHLKLVHGQELRSNPSVLYSSARQQGLRLVVPGGLEHQQGIQSLVVDLCGPDSPYCGPTRPAEDYKADVVLTEPDEYGGWLNTAYECCPCLVFVRVAQVCAHGARVFCVRPGARACVLCACRCVCVCVCVRARARARVCESSQQSMGRPCCCASCASCACASCPVPVRRLRRARRRGEAADGLGMTSLNTTGTTIRTR